MVRPFNPDLIPEPETPAAYTVTEVNNLARLTLERNFHSIRVVGEVSNLNRQPSGHIYFTLKDAESQLDAAMWREAAAHLVFDIETGMEVLAFGDLTIYTRRGRYQLSVRALEPRGVGALEVAFRQLKERLEKEGLFDEAHKKPLPFLPSRIALVTSLSGAAVKDMLKSIYSRFSRARVAILPVPVQGAGAADQIAAAVKDLNRAGGFDVIVVGRGGGSLEDLWAFNEEVLARAIYASAVPVVSAVGHERDLTISDLVADARAMTPTEVGSLIVPDEAQILEALEGARGRLLDGLRRRRQKASDDLAYAWRHPVLSRPDLILVPLGQRLDEAHRNLQSGFDSLLKNAGDRLQRLSVALEALSPLAVLRRGYSVTRDADGNVITDAASAREGDVLETILLRGRLASRVTRVTPSAEARNAQTTEKGNV